MSLRRHAGSGMIPFKHLECVAYVSSWMDCLFPKGVAQNGVRPDGSKSIVEMHPFFNCLGMKDRVRQAQSQVPYTNLSTRQRLVKWAEATCLFSFNDIPSDDARFASLNQLRESCEALFEVPEIRRACFENQVAYNVINGESCRMHSQVGIPLPVRDQLAAEDGCQLLSFHQHSAFLPLPKHDRNEGQRFRHNSLPVTTAYADASLIDGPEVGLLEAKRAYKKLRSTSLVWLMGRHFVRPNSEEEKLQLALASEIDTARIQGREKDPLIAKVKLQKTLSLHLADHIMTLRMGSNSSIPRNVLTGALVDFPPNIQPYPLRRKKLVMTQLAARAGAVLHNIARTRTTSLKNVDLKFALTCGTTLS